MKRTQLYLDEDLWEALRVRAQQSRISISELVRQAVRDKYASPPAEREKAMRAFAGLWKSRRGIPGSETYVRRIRKGGRLRRLTL